MDNTPASEIKTEVSASNLSNSPNTEGEALKAQVKNLIKRPVGEIAFDRTDFARAPEQVPFADEFKPLFALPKDGIILRFAEPQFVTAISLELEQANRLNKVTIQDVYGAQRAPEIAPSGSKTSFIVNSWVTAISIKPSDAWKKRNPDLLRSVAVSGYELDLGNLEKVELELLNWQESFQKFSETAERELAEVETARNLLKAERTQNEEKLRLIESQISEKKQEHQSIISDLEPKQNQIVALRAEIANLESSRRTTDVETAALRDETKKLETEIQTRKVGLDFLAQKIATAEAKYKELNANTNLFAIDLAGYGEQGNRQISLYGTISGVVLLLGFLATWYSLDAANDIWKEYVKDPSLLSVPVLLGIRAGFIAIVCTALYGLSVIVLQLLNRIIAIQDGKLRLSEISILARDAVEAAVAGKGYSPEQETATFVAVRMSLIKEFLSGRMKQSDVTNKDPELKPVGASEIDAVKLMLSLVKEGAKAIKKDDAP